MFTRWDPFSEMNRLHDQVARRTLDVERAGFRPAVDIREEADAYLLHIEVPGVKREDLHVEVDKGLLTIRGERKLTSEEVKKSYRRVERHYGAFARSFALPDTADGEHVTADLHDGVLDVRLPKRSEKASRKVEIRAA